MKILFVWIILSIVATAVCAQPVAVDTSIDVCTRLKTNGHGDIQVSQWKEANDTLRLYIENCANQLGSFHEFTELDGANQFISNDNNRWLDYRTWLKKVLYLNLDTDYYCGDVQSILTTFQYMLPDSAHSIDYNGQNSVIDYLLQNNRCPDAKSYLLKLKKNARDYQVQLWRDTVKDSTKTPVDTADVTLESLDLQILRGIQFAVQPTSPKAGAAIASFLASDNPFKDETTLRYTLNDAALVEVEIYDALGKLIYSGSEGLQEAGEHTIRIDGKSYSSGSYYVRLSTYSMEVKTIKLEHIR